MNQMLDGAISTEFLGDVILLELVVNISLVVVKLDFDNWEEELILTFQLFFNCGFGMVRMEDAMELLPIGQFLLVKVSFIVEQRVNVLFNILIILLKVILAHGKEILKVVLL